MSLGAGTLTGAAIGAGAGLARSAGDRLIGRMRGRERLLIDDAVLRLLMVRSLELLAALIRRGHGSPERIRGQLGQSAGGRLPRVVRRARHHPHWSALNPEASGGESRQGAIDALGEELSETLGTLGNDAGTSDESS